MKFRLNLSLISSLMLLTSCGGGGGDNNACSALKVRWKVAGGQGCEEGQPNVALVVVSNKKGDNAFSCTGSYISLTSILTAAHCFENGVGSILIASRGNVKNGVRYIAHPYYNGRINSPFDLGIIQVDSPLVGSEPLPLLTSAQPKAGDEVVAYGYGVDQSGENFLDRISNGEAPLKATFNSFVGYFSGTSAIMSTGEGSVCPGDSGGPVLAKNDAGVFGIIGTTRSGPEGCSAEAGRPSYLSSTQSNGAIDFISANVPDAAKN